MQNTSVNAALPDKEERETFYREAKNSPRYRAGLGKVIDHMIATAAEKEEGMSAEEALQSVSHRKALRSLKRLLTIGDKDGKA